MHRAILNIANKHIKDGWNYIPCIYHLRLRMLSSFNEIMLIISSKTRDSFEKRLRKFTKKSPMQATRIMPFIGKICPANSDAPFTMGYTASSPVESLNNALLSTRSQPICNIIHQCLIWSQHQVQDIYQGLNNYAIVNRAMDTIQKNTSEIKDLRIVLDKKMPITVIDGTNERFRIEIHGGKPFCPCRELEVTGLPCKHIIKYLRSSSSTMIPEDLIADIYKTDVIRDATCLEELIIPSPSDINEVEGIELPGHRRHVGRPKKKRIKNHMEQ